MKSDCTIAWQELLDSRKQGKDRLTRVQRCGAAARDHTSTVGCEALEREEAGLLSTWEQWEHGAKHVCSGLEATLAQMASSEQEFSSLAAQLEQDLQDFSSRLNGCRDTLQQVASMNTSEEAVQGWQIAKVVRTVQNYRHVNTLNKLLT